MSKLRISDASLLPDVNGSEKIPTGGRGDYAVTLDQVKTFARGGLPQQIEDHINDTENPHQVSKSQVGLGNADNTSDVDKPISTATQEALDLKANQSTTYTKTEVDGSLGFKADKTYVDSRDLLKADKTYVDSALAGFSNGAAKFYPTLAAATADIANIALKDKVEVGEVANGGTWYKATAGATSLTKSAYDPLTQAKTYTDEAIKLKSAVISVTGLSEYTLTSDDLTNSIFTLSGVLSSDFTLTIPSLTNKKLTFRNNCSGGFIVNLRSSTQGSADPVQLKYNQTADVFMIAGGSLWEVGRQKADLDSPSFIGTPRAYTPAESSRDTQLATTLYVARATREFKVINLSNVDHTLTLDEMGYSTVVFTGSATKDLTITFPKVQSKIAVRHAVTGGFKLNLKVLDSATTLIMSVNDTIEVHSNAVSLYRIDNDRAPLASPTFTGTPKAPTPVIGVKDTTIATTEFVQRESHGSTNIQVNDDFVAITAAQCQYKNMFLYGTLTKNITITMGETNGSWNIQNATTGGFSIVLKSTNAPTVTLPNGAMRKVFAIGGTIKQISVDGATLAPATTTNLGGIKVGSGLAITGDGTLSAIGGGGGGGITNYKGNFKAYENYVVGDIVEHGSGIYECVLDVTNVVTPLNNSAFLKKSSNLAAGANRSIITLSSEVTSLEGKKSINFVANDGTTCFSVETYRYLYLSLDFGQTWEEFYNFGNGKVGAIKQLANNELLVAFNNAATTPQARELWLTKGYGTDTVTWSKVFEVQREGIYFAQGWSFSTYRNLVFAVEYGPKYTPDIAGSSLEGENARYAYMSKDSGKTWSICFDLNSLTDGIGVHTHGICYDEYWQRIWVSHGDGYYGSNGLWYSDDLGETWVSALQTQGTGANWNQCVGQYSLPTCLIFASDSSPNGIYRIDRAQGKYPTKGYYDIEVGYQIPHSDTENLNYLSHSNIKTAFTPNPMYLFAFSPETRAGQSHIVATYNGWDYFPLWTDALTTTAGRGVINIEMTAKNEIIGTSNDTRFGTGIQAQVKLKIKIE